jgi:hypothetical protein
MYLTQLMRNVFFNANNNTRFGFRDTFGDTKIYESRDVLIPRMINEYKTMIYFMDPKLQ